MLHVLLAVFCLTLPSWASDRLSTMSLEEKVGQLLMVHFHGEEATEEARALIQDIKVGGFIYYNWSNGLTSPQQVLSLSSSLQKLARANPHAIPLFIATDQEGGIVTRLTEGFTIFPGNRALGMTGDPQLSLDCAMAMGRELAAVGINMNLAPVVDVNINPRNPVIGLRSYGNDPETVVVFGEKAIQGFHFSQIMCALKHFPGHGDVEIDSHEDLSLVYKPIDELRQVELFPFATLAPIADAIMTAHLLVPALDPDHCATLSAKTLSYLREELCFDGVIVTDSLIMKGVLKTCGTVDEAAIQALKAGCDLLLIGGKQLIGGDTHLELQSDDVQRIHASLVTAVKTGRIPESRVDEAVERILKLKENYLIPPRRFPPVSFLAAASHRALAKKVATLALNSFLQNPTPLPPLSQKKIALLAPQTLKTSIQSTSLLSIGRITNVCFFNEVHPTADDVLAGRNSIKGADIVLACSYNAWKYPEQKAYLQSLIEMGKPVILIVTKDPLDAELFPRAHLIFNTFSPTTPSLQAVYDCLRK